MKTSKGFAPIAIVLIIIAVLAVGGVAYYARTKNNSQPADKNIVDTNTGSIKITFPTAGATLVEGKTYSITWTNSANSNVTYSVGLENDLAGYFRIGETSEKSYSWTVPSILDIISTEMNVSAAPVNGYRVLVINLQDKAKYYSSTFKIAPASSTTSLDYNFSASPKTGLKPLTVNFLLNLSGNQNSDDSGTYIVDSGDGISVNMVNDCGTEATGGGYAGCSLKLSAQHTYTLGGNYMAKLSTFRIVQRPVILGSINIKVN